MGEEGNVSRVHLLHPDAEACAVDGAVDDEQLPAGSAVAVADHAGEVGGAEEAREVLKGGEALPGPRGGDDEAGAVGLPGSLHFEVPLPDLDALHLGALDSDAEALSLGESCFQEVRACDGAVAKVVLDVLRVMGPSTGTVEEQDAEVVASEVDTSLQAPGACPDDYAVEGYLGALGDHADLSFHMGGKYHNNGRLSIRVNAG